MPYGRYGRWLCEELVDMKIASVTITSETKADIIGDCLRSVVGHVDANILVVIDNDPDLMGSDNTIEVARSVCGDKLLIFHYDGSDFSCGDCRNFGLKCAQESGFDWAFQLDTDERFMPDGKDLRRTLEQLPATTMTCSLWNADNTYEKLLLFRLPVRAKYRYHIHEEWTEIVDGAISGMRYWELPKPEGVDHNRNASMLRGLEKQISEDPDNPRWYYYKGQVSNMEEDFENAIDCFTLAFSKCDNEKHFDLKAWTCFCAANVCLALKEYADACNWCLRGIGTRGDCPELYTTIAKVFGLTGRLEECITFCELAVSQSPVNVKRRRMRSGFVHLPASFEEPYLVMSEAYRALGETRLSEWAKREAMRKEKERKVFRR